MIFTDEPSADVMAIGSGFGYYTLSSVLIAQFKEASVGAEAAASVAAIGAIFQVLQCAFLIFHVF